VREVKTGGARSVFNSFISGCQDDKDERISEEGTLGDVLDQMGFDGLVRDGLRTE